MERWTLRFAAPKSPPTPQWGSLMHGMLMEKLPAPWQEVLHTESARPFAQWLEVTREGTLLWHVSALSDELAEVFRPLLTEGSAWTCRKLNETLTVEAVTHEVTPLQAFTRDFFLKEASCERLRITFCTATTHHVAGSHALYPTVELIARSIQQRLCTVQPDSVLADDEVVGQIIERTRIVRYKLQSASYALEGTRLYGYTGYVELHVKGPDPLLRLAELLFSFAPWCGVGVKAALGMGGCRVSPVERKGAE